MITDFNIDDAKRVWREERLEEGIKIGRKAGIEIALKNGEPEGYIAAAKSMLQDGISSLTVDKYTNPDRDTANYAVKEEWPEAGELERKFEDIFNRGRTENMSPLMDMLTYEFNFADAERMWINEWREVGLRAGIGIGIKNSEPESYIEAAKNILRSGVDVLSVAKCLRLDRDTVQRLADAQ